MKISFTLILITLSCTFCGTLKAVESPWYEVEILVFEQSDVNRLNAEKWDQKVPLVDTKESIDFITLDPSLIKLDQICLNGNLLEVKEMLPFAVVEKVDEEVATTEQTVEAEVAEELPFKILHKDLNKLNDLETTLRRRRGFRSLMHITWRQPVDSKKHSKLIRLYTGKNYSETFNPEGDARVDIATYIPEETNDENSDPALNAIDTNDLTSESSGDKNTFQGSYVESTEAADSTPFSDEIDNTIDTIDPVQAEQDKRKQQLNNCQKLQQEIVDNRHQDVWQIDGNIRLYVERYLHIETDLMLRLPGKVEIQLGAIETSLAADRLLNNLDNDLDKKDKSSEDGFGWQLGDNFLTTDQDTSVIQQDILNKYSMLQSRRMKSNEVHYIDHPLFGILIEIRPFDKDAANKQEENQTNSAN